MSRFACLAALIAGCLGLVACAADPSSSCSALCSSSGFDIGTADVQPNEINCFCSGGDGTPGVTDESCKSMCDGLGRSSSEMFNEGDACQCS